MIYILLDSIHSYNDNENLRYFFCILTKNWCAMVHFHHYILNIISNFIQNINHHGFIIMIFIEFKQSSTYNKNYEYLSCPQISAFFHKSFFQSGILQSVTSRYLTMSVPSSQYLKETLLDFFRDWQLSDQSEFTFDFEILIKVKQCKVSNIIALWMSILHFKTTLERNSTDLSTAWISQAKNAIKQKKLTNSLDITLNFF